MARIWLVCLVLLAAALPPCAARAGEPIFESFDAAPFGNSEMRLLQTALAAAGDYRGPLDGDWGRESQAALESYATREFGAAPLNLHAAALVLGLIDEVGAGGWDFRYLPELGVSLALPLGRLGPSEPEGGGERRWTDDGRMTVLTQRFDADEARRWHGAAVKANASAEALATEREPDRLVTRGVLRDGRSFYTRSDLAGGLWPTVLLAGEPDQAGALNLAAASIRPGQPLPWDLPAGGRLTGLIDEAEAFLIDAAPDGSAGWPAAAPAAPRAAALPDSGFDSGFGGTSTGSGFYLAARALVTAQHVVADCARVTLADGRELELVAADPDLDVALLRAPAAAGHWLSLAEGGLRLGQQVHAAGFPYYSIAGTSLNLTSGNVSALAGVDDDRRFFTFSAPVQPGNSGGPLIDSHGGVRGLVVARLSEDFIIEATGSLPQNVNYALGEAELARFLLQHGAGPSPGGLGDYDLAEGAPPEINEAVVPIVCH